MCCFLKGRGKGACETPNVSTVDSLAASIWIWISHQTKNKDFSIKILLVRSLPTTPLQKDWILVPWMTHGKLGGSVWHCQKEGGLESLPFWLTHMHSPLHTEGNLSHWTSAHKEQFYKFCLQMTSWWHVRKESLSHVWEFIHARILKCCSSLSGEYSTGPLGPYRISLPLHWSPLSPSDLPARIPNDNYSLLKWLECLDRLQFKPTVINGRTLGALILIINRITWWLQQAP